MFYVYRPGVLILGRYCITILDS